MNRLHAAIEAAGGKPLLGAALYSYDPIFLEISGRLGFKVIWIEMEHAAISFAEAADLCRMAKGTGQLTMIRIPDARRESVLKASECGPDMIDIPMADSPEPVLELVRYAKFAPIGARGFFSVSRALKYGIVDSVPDEQQRINSELCLLAQIETKESLARVEEIAAIPGVDIFIGPADMAASMGLPGQTAHPRVLAAAEHIIQVAREHGKKVATACGAADYIHWLRLGVDLLFCANNVTCLRTGAQFALDAVEKASLIVAGEASLAPESDHNGARSSLRKAG
jgi:2-keto-3-deoxy-L-rhamnonate aldolase RhmA